VNLRGAAQVNKPERSYIPDFLNHHAPKGGLVLEIGPGAAGNLLFAKDLGFRTATLDVSTWNNDYFKNVCEFDHVHQNMESIPDDSCDAVIATHVIEHVSRPLEFLKAIRGKMRSGAKLLIGTPNCDFPYTTLFGNRWWVYGVDDHVSFFNCCNLRLALDEAGFRNTITSSHNTNGGHSLSWFLKSGIRGFPYGLRSRDAREPNASLTAVAGNRESTADCGCKQNVRQKFKNVLELPFKWLTDAGYGYELVATAEK